MPGGYALYRYGCRTCLRAGAVVILISSVLYPLAPSLWQASLMCPILTALIVVPICFGVLHDGPLAQRPTDRPFSSVEDEDTDSTAGRGTARRLDFWRSLRLGAVWHLAFMSLYQLYIIIALINTLTLCLKMDVHMDLQVSAMYSSIVFVTSIAGKLFMGAAMDSKFQGIAGMLRTLLPLDFSQAGGSLTRSHTQLLAFAMVYGMGFGGTYSLLSAKPAKLLGRMADFGKLQGFLMLFQVIGGFLGTLVTGKLRDLSGSYTWSFYVFIIMAFLACCHYAALEAGSRSTLQAIAESQEA
eukprot:g4450.t1